MTWTYDDERDPWDGIPASVKRDTARAYESQEHAASIRAIPHDQFPDDAARAELIRLALTGAEVYAYRPVGGPEWVIWHYHGNPAEDCRQSPAEWARKWRENAGEAQ